MPNILFGIVLTLLNKGKVTAKYLADKYDVSVRTIYRYISILDTCNIPVITVLGKHGGITLQNKIFLNSLFFTASEKVALLSLTNKIENKSIQNSIITKLMTL